MQGGAATVRTALLWSVFLGAWTVTARRYAEWGLFLTRYIEEDRIAKAREFSRVTELVQGVESYSGYITVNPDYDSNLFFWFCTAEKQKSDAPVLLWLNGGPGVTSMMGALLENGPIAIHQNGTAYRRPVAWTKSFNVLYIDSPVEVGYSFTRNKEAGMTKTMEAISENLYRFLQQFFRLFPDYANNPFYIGGQSYAGKYIPALGAYIHARNQPPMPDKRLLINMKGMYLGGGFCDPVRMVPAFVDSLYYMGLVSIHDRQKFLNDSEKATTELDKLTVFANAMGAANDWEDMDNILGAEYTNGLLKAPMKDFLRSNATRHALHVGHEQDDKFDEREQSVFMSIIFVDMLIDTIQENRLLMDNYKVLHYSGNLDVVVTVAMTEAFLPHVHWKGRQQYLSSSRQRWEVEGKVLGWYTVIGNFSRVIIRNAGHMTPYDQPETTLDMMNNFVFDKPYPHPTQTSSAAVQPASLSANPTRIDWN